MTRTLCALALLVWLPTIIAAAVLVGALIPFERQLFPDQFREKDHANND